MSAVLDSWAVLAWLQGFEPAAARVRALFTGRDTLMMSWINACEVYYRIERTHDRARAEQIVSALRERLSLELPSAARCLQSARIKAEHPIALADCFCAATALAHDASVWTGDPELLSLAGVLPLRTHDLRPDAPSP